MKKIRKVIYKYIYEKKDVEKIKKFMEKNELTYKDMANKLNISSQYLRNVMCLNNAPSNEVVIGIEKIMKEYKKGK